MVRSSKVQFIVLSALGNPSCGFDRRLKCARFTVCSIKRSRMTNLWTWSLYTKSLHLRVCLFILRLKKKERYFMKYIIDLYIREKPFECFIYFAIHRREFEKFLWPVSVCKKEIWNFPRDTISQWFFHKSGARAQRLYWEQWSMRLRFNEH